MNPTKSGNRKFAVAAILVLVVVAIGAVVLQQQHEHRKLRTAFAKIESANSAVEEADAFDLLFFSTSSIELRGIDLNGDSVGFDSPELSGVKIFAGGKEIQHQLIDVANLKFLMRE